MHQDHTGQFSHEELCLATPKYGWPWHGLFLVAQGRGSFLTKLVGVCKGLVYFRTQHLILILTS